MLIEDSSIETDAEIDSTVTNKKGTVLPGTGGVGTTLFMILGGGAILFALYSLKKDKIKEEKDC